MGVACDASGRQTQLILLLSAGMTSNNSNIAFPPLQFLLPLSDDVGCEKNYLFTCSRTKDIVTKEKEQKM